MRSNLVVIYNEEQDNTERELANDKKDVFLLSVVISSILDPQNDVTVAVLDLTLVQAVVLLC